MAPKNTPAVEEIEEEDEVEGMRPKDLAEMLEISPKALRGWLRKEYPRNSQEKNTSWYLTDDQVEAATAAFADTPDEDEDDNSDEE